MVEAAAEGHSVLLVAPTGAGKTLSGFLPTLIELTKETVQEQKGRKEIGQKQIEQKRRARSAPVAAFQGPHTLYLSPLKALAVDIERNLVAPVSEMGLPITIESRTGDTSQHKRRRQKLNPPDILLTTPEQLALLIASSDAPRFFKRLRTVVLDELHALVPSKRGDLMTLGLARLRRFAPHVRMVGLSATVRDPVALSRVLVPQTADPQTGEIAQAKLITVAGGAKPIISIADADERIPWAGHTARWALPTVYDAIRQHRMTLIFVNTRSQAEMLFQELWKINEASVPIALHHGSLEVAQRRRVEAAMSTNSLRAVVATSTLDLGIDWGDVDLVIHVGAPKGASRLAQRVGRANHRMDEASKALLVPANRFEVMECQAALNANYLGFQDTPAMRPGGLDVLAQHVLGCAVGEAFDASELFEEVRSALPYAALDRATFDQVVHFVATGGYALKAYERYARIRQRKDGKWRISHPDVGQQYRLNVGTIIEAPYLNVRLNGKKRGARSSSVAMVRGGKMLGKVEEYFLETLTPGDTFLFAGEVLRFEGIHEQDALVTRSSDPEPQIPYYAGGKFPLSTFLADQVRAMLADPASWPQLPSQVQDWLTLQSDKSVLPSGDQLLVETFPRGGRYYMIAYPFEGRLAHQTLGMLLTRRLERTRLRPMGFVATDYAIGIWALEDMGLSFARGNPSLDQLFEEDMLGDDLEAWMADSYLLKRTFRNCALISGLIEQRHPGKEKTGRQVTISTDLIYDVLREHEPNHILMRATWADAASNLLDIERLGQMLSRIKNRIVHQRLDRISPLAVPIMLEVGKEAVRGEAQDAILAEASAFDAKSVGHATDILIAEAMGQDGSVTKA